MASVVGNELNVVTIAHPSKFDAEIERLTKSCADNKFQMFVLVTGAKKDGTDESWCPDCVLAEPIIRKAMKSADDPPALLVECPVIRSEYKGKPDYPYRQHPKLRLKSIPTLYKWGTAEVLGEKDCSNPDLVELLVNSDD